MFIVSFLKFSPETTKTYQGIANNYTCDNILNTTSNNTTTCKHNNISKTKQLSLSLSPPQRSLCVLGRLGREKKKVHKGRWQGERKKRGLKDPAFSLFSLSKARFLYFNCCFVLIPLWRREGISNKPSMSPWTVHELDCEGNLVFAEQLPMEKVGSVSEASCIAGKKGNF